MSDVRRSTGCTRCVSIALATFCLVSATLAQRQRVDELTFVFDRWYRALRTNRIKPTDTEGPRKKPLVPGARRGSEGRRGRPSPGQRWGRPFDRVDEAAVLFRRLAQRGKKEDGERLVSVVRLTLSRPGGRLWERIGGFSRMRAAVLRAIAGKKCPEEIKAAVVEALDTGVRELAGVGGGSARLRHREPALANVLVKLIATFGEPRFRHVLERCLSVEQPEVHTRAAQALAAMEFGPSLSPVARVLCRAKLPDDVAMLAGAIVSLTRATKPPPKERDLKAALTAAVDRLDSAHDWRSQIALVPVLRTIRSQASVPLLIGLLEQSNARLSSSGERRASGTLVSAVHEALVDLSGFWAPAREPQRWRQWWDAAKDTFTLATKPTPIPGVKNTSAGFFGIPVTGNRIVFVVDLSGSMAWPFEKVTMAGGGRARGGMRPPPGSYETRYARATKEVMRAVSALPQDAKVNVVLFAGNVRTWRKGLVAATPANKRALQSFLSRQIPDGATALWDGMKRAMEVKLDKRRDEPYGSHVDEIFVLSDGSPSAGEIQDLGRILQLVTDWNRGACVRIHTIYIADGDRGRGGRRGGAEPLASPRRFMKELAELNNGKFVRPQRGR